MDDEVCENVDEPSRENNPENLEGNGGIAASFSGRYRTG